MARIPRKGAPVEQRSPSSRFERKAVEWTALGLAALYGCLIALRWIFLTGDVRAVLVVTAASCCVALSAIYLLLRNGRFDHINLLAFLVCLVPSVNGLIHLAVTREIIWTNLLVLTLVGAAGLIPNRRTVLALYGIVATAWLTIVLLRDFGPFEQVGGHALLLASACAIGALIFTARKRAVEALQQAKHRAGTQSTHLQQTQVSREESERRFREVFTASPVGIALADENGHFTEVNDAWCELLGRSQEELLGRSSRPFTHPDDLPQHAGIQDRIDEAAPVGGVVRVEKRYIRPDGEIRWGWLSIAPVHGPEGQRWTLAHAQDITERKAAEAALQRSQAALAAIARVARCVQSGEDPRPTVLDELRDLSDAAAVAIFEQESDGVLVVSAGLGVDVTGIQLPLEDGCAPATAWRTGERQLVFEPFDSGAQQRPAMHTLAQQGDRRILEIAALLTPSWATAILWQPVLEKDQVIALLAVAWDRPISRDDDPALQAVQALADETASAFTAARLRDELESLVDTDPLTGVANRRGWHARVRELTMQSRRTGQPLSLAVIDLDHFKTYNDSFGHHKGDVLLREFAARANSMLRAGDVIARWGGEEFAVALAGCAATDAGHILERLSKAVPDGQTCSIGHATLRPGESATDCLVRADAALYQAKDHGRNQVLAAAP